MSRDPQLRLSDITDACERIGEYLLGYDCDRFLADSKTQDAVIRQFEIIGEAVKGLPEAWKTMEKEVPWRMISGFRDVLVHSYFSVEPSIVWDAAVNKLPLLHAACKRLLSNS